ncbi:hypothetical protein RFI_14722 [Reticulomyxa filosa]|uniref:Cyclic nucleotide-binding domain-containing protein n=1 Tax=Reticulomyxa filosa TaxID=46433 RepID=X6N8W7_RETFI|nr:hypothetical protein RFI_14722 [Reticulomyxa filosa]|eukprot:ETO22476.1 hypothetical protein RFI_14722 [Reticulomyxa filosa]
MVLGTVTFTFGVTQVVQSIAVQSKYNTHVQNVTAWTKHNQEILNDDIINEIRLYFQYKHERVHFEEQDIVQLFPLHMRKRIMAYIYGPIVANVPLFSHCSKRFLTELVVRLKSEFYNKYSVIYERGSVRTHMFILKNGLVAIYDDKISISREDLLEVLIYFPKERRLIRKYAVEKRKAETKERKTVHLSAQDYAKANPSSVKLGNGDARHITEAINQKIETINSLLEKIEKEIEARKEALKAQEIRNKTKNTQFRYDSNHNSLQSIFDGMPGDSSSDEFDSVNDKLPNVAPRSPSATNFEKVLNSAFDTKSRIAVGNKVITITQSSL